MLAYFESFWVSLDLILGCCGLFSGSCFGQFGSHFGLFWVSLAFTFGHFALL